MRCHLQHWLLRTSWGTRTTAFQSIPEQGRILWPRKWHAHFNFVEIWRWIRIGIDNRTRRMICTIRKVSTIRANGIFWVTIFYVCLNEELIRMIFHVEILNLYFCKGRMSYRRSWCVLLCSAHYSISRLPLRPLFIDRIFHESELFASRIRFWVFFISELFLDYLKKKSKNLNCNNSAFEYFMYVFISRCRERFADYVCLPH